MRSVPLTSQIASSGRSFAKCVIVLAFATGLFHTQVEAQSANADDGPGTIQRAKAAIERAKARRHAPAASATGAGAVPAIGSTTPPLAGSAAARVVPNAFREFPTDPEIIKVDMSHSKGGMNNLATSAFRSKIDGVLTFGTAEDYAAFIGLKPRDEIIQAVASQIASHPEAQARAEALLYVVTRIRETADLDPDSARHRLIVEKVRRDETYTRIYNELLFLGGPARQLSDMTPKNREYYENALSDISFENAWAKKASARGNGANVFKVINSVFLALKDKGALDIGKRNLLRDTYVKVTHYAWGDLAGAEYIPDTKPNGDLVVSLAQSTTIVVSSGRGTDPRVIFGAAETDLNLLLRGKIVDLILADTGLAFETLTTGHYGDRAGIVASQNTQANK